MSCEIGYTVQSGTDSVGFNGTQASVQVIEVSPIALLAGVSPSESREIISIARSSSYATGKNPFLESQSANSLILIETGRVKHSRVGRDGGEVILRICGPGEIVDVYDESGNGRDSYSAQAMGDCGVLIWDSKQALHWEFKSYIDISCLSSESTIHFPLALLRSELQCLSPLTISTIFRRKTEIGSSVLCFCQILMKQTWMRVSTGSASYLPSPWRPALVYCVVNINDYAESSSILWRTT
jgi:cyclic nucleotide-binding protein